MPDTVVNRDHSALCRDIFRRGSRTYYFSSAFFPFDVKRDVFTLYSFVRTADDFLDCVPQRGAEFYEFCAEYERGIDRGSSENPVIDGFVELAHRKGFRAEWSTRSCALWSRT
jgi:phytoene synthase